MNPFSTWQINWDDKVTNLTRIAEDLKIGIDSFVFIDDSAFECDWVRKQLSQVAVVQLDGKISSYRNILNGLGFFDSLTFSEEDRNRSGMYVQAKERKQLLQSALSLEEYLFDLQLQAEIGVPGKIEIPRISQLTQKTNQFNLTSHRYTEGEIKSFLESSNSEVYYLRLGDRISDLGIVGVAILKFEDNLAEIDSFLFSCRALGRGAEDALLVFVTKRVFEEGKNLLTGKYLQTPKNSQVVHFYKKHGFQITDENDEWTNWSYLIEPESKNVLAYPKWISVKLIS